jgi:hypothetical protein
MVRIFADLFYDEVAGAFYRNGQYIPVPIVMANKNPKTYAVKKAQEFVRKSLVPSASHSNPQSCMAIQNGHKF